MVIAVIAFFHDPAVSPFLPNQPGPSICIVFPRLSQNGSDSERHLRHLNLPRYYTSSISSSLCLASGGMLDAPLDGFGRPEKMAIAWPPVYFIGSEHGMIVIHDHDHVAGIESIEGVHTARPR
jgi:hypothetical protein